MVLGAGWEGARETVRNSSGLRAINRYTVAREVVTKGVWMERVMWSVSADGNTMASVNVNPNDPTRVTVMVFDRVAGPAGGAQ